MKIGRWVSLQLREKGKSVVFVEINQVFQTVYQRGQQAPIATYPHIVICGRTVVFSSSRLTNLAGNFELGLYGCENWRIRESYAVI